METEIQLLYYLSQEVFSMSETQGFKKSCGLLTCGVLALGAIVGWGCFVLPGNAFLPKSGPLGMAIGMLIGASIVILISLSYGYLIQKFPVSGGEFVYADSAFGKIHGFICGWGLILAYWSLIPLNATAVGLISRYLSLMRFRLGNYTPLPAGMYTPVKF